VASNLIGWFSQLNAGLFLMRNLFVCTSSEFQKKRNTFESASGHLFDEKNLDVQESIFDKFKR